MNIVRHHTVYQPNDPNPLRADYAPHIDDDTLHIYSHWAETVAGETNMLRSHVRSFSPDAIEVTVSGWRRTGHHPIYSTFYFVREHGSWIRRRRSHQSVKALLAGGTRNLPSTEEIPSHE